MIDNSPSDLRVYSVLLNDGEQQKRSVNIPQQQINDNGLLQWGGPVWREWKQRRSHWHLLPPDCVFMLPTVYDGEGKREKGFLTDYSFHILQEYSPSQNTQPQQGVKGHS